MSRHGKLAPGKVRINFVADEALRIELDKLAVKKRRKLSDFLRVTLEDIVQSERLAVSEDQTPYITTKPTPLPVDARGTAPVPQPAKAKRAG